MIANSLDWSTERGSLHSKIRDLPYNSQLRTMLKNIDGMVEELSRLEVEARRTKKMGYSDAQLNTVNSAIQTLEQWIIMGAFLK